MQMGINAPFQRTRWRVHCILEGLISNQSVNQTHGQLKLLRDRQFHGQCNFVLAKHSAI